MPTLLEVQRAMRRSLVEHDDGEAAAYILADGLAPEARLNVYRNTAIGALTTALRLAEVENPLIAAARQRIGEALAVQQGARVLLLPTLNVGTSYDSHTGNLQRSSGTILNLDKKSLYFGGGGLGLGALIGLLVGFLAGRRRGRPATA